MNRNDCRRVALRTLALGLLAVSGVGRAAAQPPNDPPATTLPPRTEVVPSTGERIGNAVDRVGAGIRDSFNKMRGGVHAMSVQSRLYSRLHWEKSLQLVEFDVQVSREGTAVVRGVVPEPSMKARALELARETVGITQVVDELVVSRTGVISPGGTTRTTIETKPITTPVPR